MDPPQPVGVYMNTEQDKEKNILPDSGFMRLSQIIGNKEKGIPPIIPVGKSTWWAGVKDGRYPPPVKLSKRVTCWRVEDIKKLIGSS